MEFLLDTANLETIRKYNEIYNITGVTTNPVIISRESCEFFPRLLAIREIIGDKQLHVQVTASSMEEMLMEAEAIGRRIDKNVYIKVPANEEGIKTMKALKAAGYNVTATIIYTVQQAIMSANVGADYAAPYFNHICNNTYDAVQVIGDMAKMLKMYNKPTKLLAASFRNTNQILQALSAGAEAVTVAPELYATMLENPFVNATMQKFTAAWDGLYGNKKIYEL